MPPIESALVVLVPDAEVLVKPFRDRHDPSAAVGVPAHITLLYPFIAPDESGSAVLDDLRQCFQRFPPFDFSFAESRRFPGVLYLAPEPAEPFRELRLDGRKHLLEGLLFFVANSHGVTTGNARQIFSDPGSSSDASKTRGLFEVFESELSRSSSATVLDAESRAALEALGYIQ